MAKAMGYAELYNWMPVKAKALLIFRNRAFEFYLRSRLVNNDFSDFVALSD